MSKKTSFKLNILNLTRASDIQNALKNWDVCHRITKKGTLKSTCELCGTRFNYGYLMKYKNREITIGGDCAKQIFNQAISPTRKGRKTAYYNRLFQNYYRSISAVDYGTWKTWLIENAPKRLEKYTIEMENIEWPLSEKGMNELTKFHDAKRKYSAAALLEEYLEIIPRRSLNIPKEITLNQYRRLIGELSSRNISTRLLFPLPFIRARNIPSQIPVNKLLALRSVVPKGLIESLEKEELSILYSQIYSMNKVQMKIFKKLSELSEMEKKLPASVSKIFVPANSTEKVGQFLWNRTLGLGYVPESAYASPGVFDIWLFRNQDYQGKWFKQGYFFTLETSKPSVALSDLNQLWKKRRQ